MGKSRRGARKGRRIKEAKQTVLGSDDEELYSDLKRPDSKSREYFYDEIDDFLENQEKILLENDARKKPRDTSDEEEVLGLSEDDDDEEDEFDDFYSTTVQKDEMASDIEGNDEEGLPDVKAWGKKKSIYYDTDFVDKDFEGFAGSDAELAEAEEKEALALQKRLAQEIDDADIGLEWFQAPKKSEDKIQVEEKVAKDLSKLSKREKLELLKKESPEFLGLVEDFKTRMTELNERLQPMLDLAEDGKLPPSLELDYFYTKYHLILNYCTNISFYMVLKARRTPVQHHPVIKRLVAYRNLLKQLEPLGKKLESDADALLARIKNGEEILEVSVESKTPEARTQNAESRTILLVESDVKSRKRKPTHPDRNVEIKKTKQFLTEDEKDVLEMYEQMKEDRKRGHEQFGDDDDEESEADEEASDANEVDREAAEEEEEEETEETKRGVTYEIAKNKGLTPHRKKEYRNPRVRNRMKYRKAKIRRKGQVREVRNEMQRYGGEYSGIRAAVVRSVKIK